MTRTDTQILDQYERLIREGGSFGLFISAAAEHVIAGRADITPDVAEMINLRQATGPCHTIRDVLNNLLDEHEYELNGAVN